MSPLRLLGAADRQCAWLTFGQTRQRFSPALPQDAHAPLLGVLTDRDLKRALDPSLGLPPKEELFVRDVFVPDAYVVDVAEPLDGVLEHLSTQHIGSALVIKHGRLVGIFTLTDAARIFANTCGRSFRPSQGPRLRDDGSRPKDAQGCHERLARHAS